MSKPILILCTLTSIATIAIAIGLSDKPSQKLAEKSSPTGPVDLPEQAGTKADPTEVAATFHQEVTHQVLQHINPQVSIADRFSRTLRPLPMRYYEADLLADSGKILHFNVIHIDTSTLPEPGRQIAAVGKYDPESKQVSLWDDGEKAFVLAKAHPLVSGAPKVLRGAAQSLPSENAAPQQLDPTALSTQHLN